MEEKVRHLSDFMVNTHADIFAKKVALLRESCLKVLKML